MRFSRRAFLAALAATTLTGPAAAAEEPATRSWTWRGATNQVVRSPIAFTAVAASWAYPAPANLRLRVSADGTIWSAWQAVTTHEQHGRPAPNGRWFGDLAVVPSSRLVEVASDDRAVEIQLDLIDAS